MIATSTMMPAIQNQPFEWIPEYIYQIEIDNY